jgi:hypothetical protein
MRICAAQDRLGLLTHVRPHARNHGAASIRTSATCCGRLARVAADLRTTANQGLRPHVAPQMRICAAQDRLGILTHVRPHARNHGAASIRTSATCYGRLARVAADLRTTANQCLRPHVAPQMRICAAKDRLGLLAHARPHARSHGAASIRTSATCCGRLARVAADLRTTANQCLRPHVAPQMRVWAA